MRTKRAFSPTVWVLGFLPGGLLGACLASLLFFLNPDLDFSATRVARSIVFYTMVVGGVSSVAHSAAAWAFRWSSRRWLPWAMTLGLSLTTVGAWVHASHYSFYLTPGLDNRLLKAAISLTVFALATFYTTLLHTLNSRPWSYRSQLLVWALCFLTVGVMIERRSAWKPSVRQAQRPVFAAAQSSPRLLVVAIESATLDVILPVTGQGRLPFLGTLLRQGAYGRLGTFGPTRRSPVWYSLASGQYPYKHGVVSENGLATPFSTTTDQRYNLRPMAAGMDQWGPWIGLQRHDLPPTAKSPALWDFLQRFGLKTAMVGWPAPDETLAGCDIAISDSFLGRSDPGSEVPPGIPPGVLTSRVTARDIDPALLARFGESPPSWLAESLAQDLWRESIALRILEAGNTDALFLGLPGLQRVATETFGGYDSAQFAAQTSPRSALASQQLTTYYAYLDAALSRLWQRIEGPKLLLVTSAWGIDEPGADQWLTSLIQGGRPMGGRYDNQPDGVLMLLGDNLASGTFLDGADVLDVAPTILYALGLPLAPDLDGRVLTDSFGDAFLDRTPLTFVPSYRRRVQDP